MTIKEAVKQLKDTCKETGCDNCPYRYYDWYSCGWCCSISLPMAGVPEDWDEDDNSLGGGR